MKRLIYLVMTCATILSCSSNETAQTKKAIAKDGVLVKLNQAKTEEKEFTLEYSGITEPVLTIPLSFQLPGTVIKTLADEGDRVQKGQLLAELDQTSFESTYSAALAMQTQAKDAYDRLKKVYDNGSLPEIKWEEVKSKLEQANSSAEIAKKNLANCQLTSPISGMIGSRSIEVGENATPGMSIYKVISVSEIYARISAPENEINKIKKGQHAKINLPALGDQTFDGCVEKTGIVANQIAKTFEVKLKIDNPDFKIKPGMVCEVSLSLDSAKPEILVPIQTVLKDQEGNNYMYVVDQQSMTAKRREVKITGIRNNRIGITSGLNPGEWIVVEGQHKISNNSIVKFN